MKLTNKIRIDDGLTIGVGKASKTTKQPYWQAYIYFPAQTMESKPTALYKSLKLKYDPEDPTNERRARDRARQIYEPLRDKYLRGDTNFLQKITITYVMNAFFQDAEELTEANEAKQAANQRPTHRTPGNKGYWTRQYLQQMLYKVPTLTEFFNTMSTQEIKYITWRDLNSFSKWHSTNRPKWSPSSINHHITLINSIWKFARREGWVEQIHQIDRAAPDIQGRKARHLTVEEFEQIEKYLREKYNSPGLNDYYRDLAFQHWAWVVIHSWCGIRPANGAVEKNLIKWSHLSEDANGNRYLYREDEKAHPPYLATIHPYSHYVWDLLKEFHEQRGTYDPEGYVFVHTHDGKDRFTWYCDLATKEVKAVPGSGGGAYRRFKRGDYIKNFRTAWRTMLRDLDLDMPKGTARKDSLSPYTLRHFFIQQRMDANPDLRLVDLAKSVGSSESMLTATYYRPDAEQNHARMTRDAQMQKRKPIYHPQTGLYIRSEVIEGAE